MCLGVPMKVIESHAMQSLCETRQGEQRWIDMMLIGEQQEQTWVLVFMNAAREVISAEQAEEIANALSAVAATLKGESDIDHLFADLIDREPTLPDFLKRGSSQ